MVFALVSSRYSSVLYNSITKKKDYVDLKFFDSNNVDSIEEFFKEVTIKVNATIDCVCVMVDYRNYGNVFRKKILEISKKQSNIQSLKFMGHRELLLMGGIKKLSFLPKVDDWILFFVCEKESIVCDVWQYKEKWKFVDGGGKKKECKESDKFPTVHDLKQTQMSLKGPTKTPFICVFYENVIDENEFTSVFSNYKRIIFEKSCYNARWALNYALCSLNEDGYLKYKSDLILNKYIDIKTLDKIYFETSGYETLPFTKTVNAVFGKNDVIKVLEEEVETDAIHVEKGNVSITLDIDTDGIFTVTVSNAEPAGETSVNKKIQNIFYCIPKRLSDYNPDIQAVGIDLGTTECCAAVIRKNGPDFVVLDQTTGLRTMPSYISYDEIDSKCGQIVIDRMRHNAKCSVYDSKRIIGENLETLSIDPLWPFKVLKDGNILLLELETFNGTDTKTLEEITSNLLSHIKTTVELYQDDKLNEGVITIPSEFTNKQKEATKTAAEMTGWETIHFIPEPIAASFAYFSELDIPNNSNILICDCGGGTVDICVAYVNDGKLKILNFDGDRYLGGRDFDGLLFNHFKAVLKHKYGFDVMKNQKKYLLKQKCQDIKHKLSVTNEDWLDVDDYNPTIDGTIKITKNEFEEMSLTLMVKMKDVILRAVKNSNIPKNYINYVFQVGGGCRMPMIKKMLKEIFPNASHQCSLYPDWVVAHGAALYAYHLKSNKVLVDESVVAKSSNNSRKNVALIKQMFEKL